jgi:glycosyltransferase involved in cell wall biosynthesis
MKVLQIGPDSATLGGMATVIASLTMDPKDTVATYRPGARLQSAGVALNGIVQALLRSRRGDLWHVHIAKGGSWLREGLFLLLGRAAGRKVVLTIHNGEAPGFLRTRPRVPLLLMRCCHGIVAVTQETHDALREIGVRGRVAVIPNGVPLGAAPSTRPPIVLFAGRLTAIKGVDVLLQAWSRVSKEVEDARLLLVGAGRIADWEPAGRDGSIDWLGVLPREEVTALMARSRVVALPSRSEAFPMVVLEGMGNGCALVASRLPGVRFMLDSDESQLCTVADVDELSQKLLGFLSDAERAAVVGARNRERVSTLFSLEGMVRAHYAFYSHICSGAQGSSGA